MKLVTTPKTLGKHLLREPGTLFVIEPDCHFDDSAEVFFYLIATALKDAELDDRVEVDFIAPGGRVSTAQLDNLPGAIGIIFTWSTWVLPEQLAKPRFNPAEYADKFGNCCWQGSCAYIRIKPKGSVLVNVTHPVTQEFRVVKEV